LGRLVLLVVQLSRFYPNPNESLGAKPLKGNSPMLGYEKSYMSMYLMYHTQQ
jgi:hypothetical protein